MTELDFGCEGCGNLAPLLETADDRAIGLQCVENSPELAGVDPDAIAMLRTLTQLASVKAADAN